MDKTITRPLAFALAQIDADDGDIIHAGELGRDFRPALPQCLDQAIESTGRFNYVVNPMLPAYFEGQPITGFFNASTTMKGANHLRERIHFVGFVHERAYGDGSFGGAIEFFANPSLFGTGHPAEKEALARAAFATWPLRSSRLMNVPPEATVSSNSAPPPENQR